MDRLLPASLLGFAAGLSVLVPLRPALADERYVGGSNASDENNGSSQAPFATLQKAAEEAAAGDTINVRSGNYSMFYIGNGGISETLRVTFRRDAGAASAPVIAGGVTVAADFVTLDGFDIRGAAMMGVNVYGASNLRLTNNLIHDNQRGGVYAMPAQGRSANDIVLEANRIYRNSLDNSARTSQGGWAGAVQMSDANRWRVEHNQIYENWGEGISFTVTQGSVARHNVVSDNFSVELYMDHAIDCVFESNLVFETDNRDFFRNLNGAWPAVGIQIANEPGYAAGMPGRGNRIVNNIVIGGRAGFFYWRADGDATGMRDTLVAHNTFYGAREVLLKVDQNAHQSSRVVNNLFVDAGGVMLGGDFGGLAFEHNAWLAGEGVSGAGDVKADCGLAKPGGLRAEDYRLSAKESPCVGAGVSLSDITEDYFGGSRSGRADIGAHQFGSTPAQGGSGEQGGGQSGGAGMKPSGATGGAGGALASGGAPPSTTPLPTGGTESTAAGTGVADAPNPSTPDVGCACSVVGSAPGYRWAALAQAVLAALLLRRRGPFPRRDGT